MRIAIWGDNRPAPDPSLDRYLTDVDLLILSVEAVLTRAETNAIPRKYNPRAFIPSHYLIRGLTTVASDVESADKWINDQEKIPQADVCRLDIAKLILNSPELRGAKGRVYYFGNHYKKK